MILIPLLETLPSVDAFSLEMQPAAIQDEWKQDPGQQFQEYHAEVELLEIEMK